MTGGSAAILPRIVAIGDVDEDEIAFAQAATGALAADALDLPPALGGLERRLLLTQLVLQMGGRHRARRQGEAPLVANNPASALALADDLARLMDDMTTRGVSWDRLDELVPEDARPLLAAHARIPEDRARGLADNPRRARRHRAGGPARRADQGRSGAARRPPRRTGDRRRLDRLDAGDRRADRDHRQASRTAPWCCPASTPISMPNRGS